MASLERSDSGTRSRSNFSQTCNLLSRYLKEKGSSFGDLSLGLLTTTSNVEEQPKGALNLLPMMENRDEENTSSCKKFDNKLSVEKPEHETAPLTIFYGGQVIVFDNFPVDKAEEVLTLACKSGAAVQSSADSAATTPLLSPQSTLAPPYLPLTDLPIARRKSLARFFEKRKDRIKANNNAPYQSSKPVAPSSEPVIKIESEAWLGLASHEL